MPNTMKCGLTVYKAEGLRGLYVGSMSALMVNCAENSVLFGMRTSTTAFTGMDYYDFEHALAGSAAAFFSSIVVCPTEMIKNRMQATSELASTGKFHYTEKITVTSTTKQILSEGYTAPFRGLVGTWGREMPGYLVLFYAYAKCQGIISEHTKLNPTLNAALSGGIAGGAYWTAMVPVDVVKSRQQVLSIGSKVPIKFMDCVRDIYRISGGKGFYAGLVPMLIRTIPANGVLFGLVEYTSPQIEKLIS